MNWKKILSLFLILFFVDFFYSCCPCEDTIYSSYTHKKLTLQNVDNSGEYEIISDEPSIVRTAYGINVSVSREKVRPVRPTSWRSSLALFSSSAYAFSCGCPPPDMFVPQDSILAVRIITLSDFNSDKPADSDISEYFKIKSYSGFEELEAFINSLYYDFAYELHDFEIDLLLLAAPENTGDYRFKVQVVLSDGRILEEITEINLI